MDNLDRMIINQLQGGFPICAEPFTQVSRDLDIDEGILIGRIEALLAAGIINRFGPMYNVEQMGGHYSLVAMRVPDEDVERVAGVINDYPEIAHNYLREHAFNIWFVLAVESPDRKQGLLREIEAATGHTVYDMPKIREFFVGMKFDA